MFASIPSWYYQPESEGCKLQPVTQKMDGPEKLGSLFNSDWKTINSQFFTIFQFLIYFNLILIKYQFNIFLNNSKLNQFFYLR